MITRRTTELRGSSAIALATALTVLATPLLSIAHEASVRHIACLEHGELVDAPALTAAQLAAPAHHHSTAVVERGEQPGDTERDGHCLVVSWSHQRSLSPAEDEVVEPAQPAHAQPLEVSSEPRAALIALYRLAPKLSPPQA